LRRPLDTMSGTTQPTALGRRGYRADAKWCNNFERLVARAAVDPNFYEIAGSGVQAHADAIRAGWSA
jgi:hypothetical protein